MLAVIVHEVEKPNFKTAKLELQSHRFFGWFEKNPTLASVALRQFGQGSSQLLRNAQVWTASISQNQQLVLITNGKKFNLICHVINGDEVSPNKLDDLRRPGLKETKSLLAKYNVSPKVDVNVYSTTVSVATPQTPETEAVNGWAVFDQGRLHPQAMLGMMFLTVVSVAVERSLINEAQALAASGRSNLFVYQPILQRLRTWAALPPIDNTSLASKYLDLRESLSLKVRREEALKALELKERNLGLAISVTGIVIGAIVSFAVAKF